MTKKPLRELIPDIVQHVHRYRDTLQFNLRLFKADEGQLKTEIEQSLSREMISRQAYARVIERIPSINILKKATDKLSKVYSQPPIRHAENKVDQELVDSMSAIADVNNVMATANRLYNLQRMCAIEFFVQDRKQCMRVLAGHQFLPFSDDEQNPLNTTVLIKLMGKARNLQIVNDEDGKRVTNEDEPRYVDVFHLFSDEEFLVIDSDGHVRDDKMSEVPYPWSLGVNPAGVIPYQVVSASNFELVPYPNYAGLDIAILIPKLLADLNYAAQFLSHSIIWTRNTNLAGAEIHPDSVIELGEGDRELGQPEIGTIEPKVNIQETLQLIEFELSGYLSSIGIKGASVSAMMPGREPSGFAKAMDEGDVTAERTAQTEAFKRIEKSLWAKLVKMQEYWANAGLVDEPRKFSADFTKNFSVKFGEQKHLVSQAEKVEKVKALRDLKLMSRRQAIKELNPDFTPEQVEAYIAELDEDLQDDPSAEAAEQTQPQFNGQTEVGAEEDEVGPNRESARQ